jgi:hypothetical protein
MLSRGDHPIPQPVDEVVDLEYLAYDQKMKLIIGRTQRKIKLIVDSGILFTFEEVIIDAKRARMSELVSAGITILHASLDKGMA